MVSIIFFVFYKILFNSIMPSVLQSTREICRRKQKPDLTFYYSIDTNLASTSITKFNIDDPKKNIRNQLLFVNVDLTDKIPTDKTNYKKIGRGLGDHRNMSIAITSNGDSIVETIRNISFIFNSNNNSSSVDSLSIYGANQATMNSQGNLMVATDPLVFGIMGGMGKYLNARGKVEIRSLGQFQKRADVYFDN